MYDLMCVTLAAGTTSTIRWSGCEQEKWTSCSKEGIECINILLSFVYDLMCIILAAGTTCTVRWSRYEQEKWTSCSKEGKHVCSYVHM